MSSFENISKYLGNYYLLQYGLKVSWHYFKAIAPCPTLNSQWHDTKIQAVTKGDCMWTMNICAKSDASPFCTGWDIQSKPKWVDRPTSSMAKNPQVYNNKSEKIRKISAVSTERPSSYSVDSLLRQRGREKLSAYGTSRWTNSLEIHLSFWNSTTRPEPVSPHHQQMILAAPTIWKHDTTLGAH